MSEKSTSIKSQSKKHKNTLDTKSKKRYPNYNNKESNHEIVANSKAKRNKSSKKNLFLTLNVKTDSFFIFINLCKY